MNIVVNIRNYNHVECRYEYDIDIKLIYIHIMILIVIIHIVLCFWKLVTNICRLYISTHVT